MNNILRKPFKYSFFSASLILIAINVVLFAFTQMDHKLEIYLGLNPGLVVYGHYLWQPFTYMFVHGNFAHIFSNMLGLFFFGYSLEKAIGSKEFLLLYFVCGILSGLLSMGFYILTKNYYAILIGASGALYSVMLAFAVVYPKAKIYIWGILPIPSPILVIAYAGIELFCQINGLKTGVAHYTHLFGFAVSFLYFIIRMGINPVKIWKNAYFQQQ